MQVKAHLRSLSRAEPSAKYLSGCVIIRKNENRKWIATITNTMYLKLEAKSTKASILATSINRRQKKWSKDAQLNSSNNLLSSFPRRRYLMKVSRLKEKRAKDFAMFTATTISSEVQSKPRFARRIYSCRAIWGACSVKASTTPSILNCRCWEMYKR